MPTSTCTGETSEPEALFVLLDGREAVTAVARGGGHTTFNGGRGLGGDVSLRRVRGAQRLASFDARPHSSDVTVLLLAEMLWFAGRLRTNSEELLPTCLEETLRDMEDDGRVHVARNR